MLFDQGLKISATLNTDALKVMLLPERVRYSVRLKKPDVAAAEKASGIKLPRKIGASNMRPGQFVMCLGPDEWLIIAEPKQAPRLEKAFSKIEKSFTCSVTDISHRNVCFGIMGTHFEEAVNIGCPLDISLKAFPVGKVTRTVYESAPIILMRTGETHFGIECWRSYGTYVTGFMERFAADLSAR